MLLHPPRVIVERPVEGRHVVGRESGRHRRVSGHRGMHVAGGEKLQDALPHLAPSQRIIVRRNRRDWEKITGFINKYIPNLTGKKNVTLLQDTKNEFIDKFKPRRYPSMFLYSAEKKLIGYEDNEESMFRFSKQINTPAR
jgi:hypothetical protein